MMEAWINLEWALARSKFVYIETHLQKVILLQRNEIAQEGWEMHFLTKETAWTAFRSVQTESVHRERKEKLQRVTAQTFWHRGPKPTAQ